MTATTITLNRVFRLGAQDLPDIDPTLTPDQVLAHYANTAFPNLQGGKVSGGDVEGDSIVWRLEKNSYKANG